jgi:hypothetical protein
MNYEETFKSGNWLIATPCYESLKPWYVKSLTDTFDRLNELGYKMPQWEFVDHIYVGPARNLLAHLAIANEVAGVFWIDADMGWEMSDIAYPFCGTDTTDFGIINFHYAARKQRDGIIKDGFGFVWTPCETLLKIREANGGDFYFHETHEDKMFFAQAKNLNIVIRQVDISGVYHDYQPGPRRIVEVPEGNGEIEEIKFI